MSSRANRATSKARKDFEPWEWSGSTCERDEGQRVPAQRVCDGWMFLRKLRGRGFDELRVRGAQALAAWAERHGLSPEVRVPSDAALFRTLDLGRIGRDVVSAERLLDRFRARSSPAFFAAFDDREATLALLRRRFGAEREAGVIRRAERITAGQFDLLGLRGLWFGEPIDWHLDPVAGRKAPVRHWSCVPSLDAGSVGDSKIIWELNRHQYFATLGQAYWYTGDERYTQTFVAHLLAWIAGNPPKQGINWASSLEVAFRAISWLWALHFFKESPHLTPVVFLQALKLLYRHARHLETYLSTYYSPNTHLTGEALGLFYLGTLLPEFRRAARWREAGRRILLAALPQHVRPDGVYFEQSSYYHRYTTDIYMHFLILAQASGQDVGSELPGKLGALLDHLMSITRPDGTTPFFGDDDGGRLVALDEGPANDFRAALSTGAVLFSHPDYKYVAGEAAAETLWLLGARGLQAFDRIEARPPAQRSRAFPDGGYYVMRDGWTRAANYLLIDCGPHGTLNCGHAHADALALELASGGRPLLVDPGTYTYTGSAEMRDWFRSSAAHNTLTVDGEPSSVPAGPFTWAHIARAWAGAWTSCERFDYFEGAHDGYARLAAPVAHTRSVLFLKRDYWIVRDRLNTAGAHRYDLQFQFAPEAQAMGGVRGDATFVRAGDASAPGLEIFAFGTGGKWRRENGWVSRCYGERVPAPLWIFSATGEGPREFITFLVPRAMQNPGCRVPARGCGEVEAVGGGGRDSGGASPRAFVVEDGSVRDVLLIGGGQLSEAVALASDFEWTWGRFERDTGRLKEIVLIGGRRLILDGRDMLDAAERVGYMTARYAGEELLVETDASGAFTLACASVSRVVVNGEAVPAKGATAFRFGVGTVGGTDSKWTKAQV